MVYFSISENLERSWEILKKNAIPIVAIFVVISIISSIVSSLLSPSISLDAILPALQANDYETVAKVYLHNPTGTIVSKIVDAAITLGFVHAVLLIAKGMTTEIEFNHWKLDSTTYLKYIALDIIVDLITYVGTLFCIVPGVFFYVRLQFAPIRVIEKPEASIGECLSYSWQISAGNSLQLILLAIVQFIIVIIGLAICCVGAFPAAALCAISQIDAYLVLSGFYTNQEAQITE